MIDKITKFVIQLLHFLLVFFTGTTTNSEKGGENTSKLIGPAEEIIITIFIEYCILAVMCLLFVNNVQSFLRKLLFTLKNILRDNDI